MVYLILQLF